jgi:hypothetical protein
VLLHAARYDVTIETISSVARWPSSALKYQARLRQAQSARLIDDLSLERDVLTVVLRGRIHGRMTLCASCYPQIALDLPSRHMRVTH